MRLVLFQFGRPAMPLSARTKGRYYQESREINRWAVFSVIEEVGYHRLILPWREAGRSRPARLVTVAMTDSNSTRVKPLRREFDAEKQVMADQPADDLGDLVRGCA